MRARIFLPPKNAMQSGRAGTDWVLIHPSAAPRRPDPLMGWSGGADTQAQVRLVFGSKDEAIAYAGRNGIEYEIEQPRERLVRTRAYADNFSYTRHENWTH